MNVSAPERDTPGSRGEHAASTAMLLWSACRPEPDRRGAEEARGRGADLGLASRVATAQRVSPLLWRVVEPWAAEGDVWAETLRGDTARCKAQALMVRPRLCTELLGPLAASGVQPMVIKGIAIAGRYPQPGLRPMDDLDVLVPKDRHQDAAEALRRAGWKVTRRQGPAYSLSLAHPAMPGLPVDLHRDLAVRKEQVFRFSATDLWRARRSTSLFGAPVFIPSPELELLLIATHAGKPFHNFDRVLWAVDAAVVIDAAGSCGTPVDWNLVGELSRRAAARSALAVLLSQAQRLGADSPAWLRDVEAGPARRRALDPPRSLTWPVEPIDYSERGRLTYAVIDDPWLRVRTFLYQVGRDGLLRSPVRGGALAFRIIRRIWRLRTGAPDPGREESVEELNE